MEEQEKMMNLSLSPDVAGGVYSNLVILTHAHSEFVLDFASALPGLPGPVVRSRILMSPEHTKRLFNALADNISKYEARFGKIEIPEEKTQGNTFHLTHLEPSGTKS